MARKASSKPDSGYPSTATSGCGIGADFGLVQADTFRCGRPPNLLGYYATICGKPYG